MRVALLIVSIPSLYSDEMEWREGVMYRDVLNVYRTVAEAQLAGERWQREQPNEHEFTFMVKDMSVREMKG
jgi:hypothetical protein